MSETLILDGHKLAWHKERVDAWLRLDLKQKSFLGMGSGESCDP